MPAWAPPRETNQEESLETSKVPSKEEEEKAEVIAASPVLPDWLAVAAGAGSNGQVKKNKLRAHVRIRGYN